MHKYDTEIAKSMAASAICGQLFPNSGKLGDTGAKSGKDAACRHRYDSAAKKGRITPRLPICSIDGLKMGIIRFGAMHLKNKVFLPAVNRAPYRAVLQRFL